MVTIEQRIRLLRACDYRPRVLADFNEGEVHVTLHARHNEGWLNELCAEGLLRFHQGWYHITDAGVEELADLTAPPTTAATRIHCNAAMTLPYVPQAWNVRPGGLQHRQFGSEGIDA